MSSKAMSLKGRIKNYTKSNNIADQVVLQNYMFEVTNCDIKFVRGGIYGR